jgi:hypothetical protein
MTKYISTVVTQRDGVGVSSCLDMSPASHTVVTEFSI